MCMKQIIKNVQFIDGNRKDIVIDDGEIETVTKAYNGKGKIINVPDNMFVSPGWIDVHTHAFPKYKPYCAKPDEIGYKTGVTTVVDAGSIGADDLKLFHQMKMECVTRVFNFLNISKVGLSRRDELTDMSLIEDRNSTRLNSSHVAISYAVFCLKKKKTVTISHY